MMEISENILGLGAAVFAAAMVFGYIVRWSQEKRSGWKVFVQRAGESAQTGTGLLRSIKVAVDMWIVNNGGPMGDDDLADRLVSGDPSASRSMTSRNAMSRDALNRTLKRLDDMEKRLEAELDSRLGAKKGAA